MEARRNWRKPRAGIVYHLPGILSRRCFFEKAKRWTLREATHAGRKVLPYIRVHKARARGQGQGSAKRLRRRASTGGHHHGRRVGHTMVWHLQSRRAQGDKGDLRHPLQQIYPAGNRTAAPPGCAPGPLTGHPLACVQQVREPAKQGAYHSAAAL